MPVGEEREEIAACGWEEEVELGFGEQFEEGGFAGRGERGGLQGAEVFHCEFGWAELRLGRLGLGCVELHVGYKKGVHGRNIGTRRGGYKRGWIARLSHSGGAEVEPGKNRVSAWH